MGQLPVSSPRQPEPGDRDEEPVLPPTSEDERDEGWGDEPDARRSAGWYRRERPPHHE